MVVVRVFAGLRELLGKKEIRLELGRPTTLKDLVERTGIAPKLTPSHKILVNGRDASLDMAVKNSDEVLVFPPVGGG